MARPSSYSPDFRNRTVRLVSEARAGHETEWAAMTSVATKLGVSAETVCKWVRRSQVEARAAAGGHERGRLRS
jgi:transposase